MDIRSFAETPGIVGGMITALLFLGFLIVHKWRGGHKPLPPGPAGWPILGSISLLGPLPHRDLHKLSQEYGPLFSIRLGSVRMVVVSTSQLAEEVLKTHDQIMSSRPAMIATNKLFYGAMDGGFSPYGPYWQYARKVIQVGLLTSTRINHFRVSGLIL
jgi:cytochrome P450